MYPSRRSVTDDPHRSRRITEIVRHLLCVDIDALNGSEEVKSVYWKIAHNEGSLEETIPEEEEMAVASLG